jgi:hypothetical protein
MEYVKKWLQMHGYDIDVTEIEAAVSEYINRPVDGMVYAEVPIDPPEE